MDQAELLRTLMATGEEIMDDHGNVIGYSAQPARFKINRPYLAKGGFLVVIRDEETGLYVGTEFDALPHPKSGEPYPGGLSELAWTAQTIEEALAYLLSECTASQAL